MSHSAADRLSAKSNPEDFLHALARPAEALEPDLRPLALADLSAETVERGNDILQRIADEMVG